MRLPFNEAKATQAAAILLNLRGGSMSYMKLIKLLYLADREALLRWERPITTDRWVSMKNGPVLSNVYNLIREEPAPGENGIWRNHIQSTGYDVRLVAPMDDDELSAAEVKLLHQVFALHGRRNRWELVDLSHTLPEWKNPGTSSLPIEPADILRGEGRTSEEVADVLAELDHLALARQL